MNYITNHIATTFIAAKLAEFAELPHVPISKIPCSPNYWDKKSWGYLPEKWMLNIVESHL
jgi:hypothetical protein